jgi:hypothetical protein
MKAKLFIPALLALLMSFGLASASQEKLSVEQIMEHPGARRPAEDRCHLYDRLPLNLPRGHLRYAGRLHGEDAALLQDAR